MVFSRFTKVFVVCAIIAIGVYAGWWYYSTIYMVHTDGSSHYQTTYESNPYVRFDMEGWDLIAKNFYEQPTPAGLAQYFQLSVEKAANISTTTVAATDRTSTAQMLSSVFATATSSAEESQWAAATLAVLLYNLPPNGRNELLTNAAQQQLSDEVTNVNPSNNLYSDVGASATSTSAQIQSAYQETVATLQASTSAQAQTQLQAAKQAEQVLTNPQQKLQYDSDGVQPTIFSHIIGKTLYLDISKMSPTTLQEFQNAIANASSTPGLDSMIIDLRGNIGGSLPDAASLLGYFMGSNQYAFDLYQQGNLNVVRTTTDAIPALARYSDIAVLTDDMTQSTAEVITAAFERFHLGHVVGATTRGWGTVENEYPLTTQISSSTTYAMLLVEYLTLGPDQNPIQGNGVTPNVSISDPDWKSELSTYFRSPGLIAALKQEADSPPLQ